MSPSGNQTMDLSTDGGVSPSKSNQIEMNNQIYPRRSSNSSRSNKKTSKNDSNSTKKVVSRVSYILISHSLMKMVFTLGAATKCSIVLHFICDEGTGTKTAISVPK